MRKQHGRIAILLDRSGSMIRIASATVEGYNEFINGQKAVPGTADVLLAQFDDQYDIIYDKPLSGVEPMQAHDFVPRGATALRDAIGRTIDRLGTDLGKLAEADRPDSVTLVILTDGHENASKTYSQESIAAMVKLQSETYNWKFVFLGANQDAVVTAAAFNIPKAQAMSYAATSGGVGNVMRAMNAYAASNRNAGGSTVQGFSDEDRLKAMLPDTPATVSSGGGTT